MLIHQRYVWGGGGDHAGALGFKILQKVWLPADAALSKDI